MISLGRMTIALLTVGAAVAESHSPADAMCILALGILLFLAAGAAERRRK